MSTIQTICALHCQDSMAAQAVISIQGKNKPLQLLRKSQAYMKALGDVTNVPSCELDQVCVTIEEFVCRLYGFKAISDVNATRVAAFINNYQVNEKNDILKWKNCIDATPAFTHLREPSQLSRTDWRWEEKDDKYVFKWFEGDQVPPSVTSITDSSENSGDSVKLLIAQEGGLQLVFSRIEQLMHRHETGELNADDAEVEAILKQACDLIIIVLTGDEAMHILYNNGVGEVYQTMVKWLESSHYHLLTTAILAIGNFARQDDYCTQMMDDSIFDKLLDIFEIYNGFTVQMQKEPDTKHPIDAITLIKIQHAVLSSIRNLVVPVNNKRVAAAQGRAAPMLMNAVPLVQDHHVAYKLLATIRLLVDGQEGVAKQLASNREVLSRIAVWGHCAEHAGAAGEAPRLLAWAVKHLRQGTHWAQVVQADGCISSLVNMLVASHSVMQNEAILALTLLAIESLKKLSPEEEPDFDYEKSFITQLIKSEIGKHVTILIDTNCAKMPVEVAENLMAFLDITSKHNKVAFDYKQAKVHGSLKKFADAREDLSPDLESCIAAVVKTISDNGKSE